MSENDIIRIDFIKNINIQNLHNNFIYPKQSILKLYFRNKKYRIIDLLSEIDITEIDYFKILETKKTKIKTLFKEQTELL